ncbi:MAG: sulfatase, partial [Candidatus Binatia bacterium]
MAVLLALATTGACSPTRENRPNIVVIVLDTFRADRLGPRSGHGSLTPFLDRFAVGARYWPAATSTAALTMPAMASVMTGRHSDRAGIVGHGPHDRVGSTVPTLASLASAVGYRTVAIVTNPWLARRATGFARGYRSFTSGRTLGMAGARLPADVVTDTALATVDSEASGTTSSLLLWVHYMDMHMPYPPVPSEADDARGASTTSRIVADFSTHKADRQRIYFDAPYDAAEIEATRAQYDAAATRVDRAVGRLLDGLGRRGLLDDAIVVVLSDHGEALGDHGLFFALHFNVYDEHARVLLLLSAPGLAPGVD